MEPDQKRKVIAQIADTFIELSKHPFPLLGSLSSPDKLHIGPVARESVTDFQQSTMIGLGPCSSLLEYHLSTIRLILDLIVRDEMYSQRPLEAYLIHRFLMDIAPLALPAEQDGKFYLKHPDDKGDHILANEDFNITGIIDWEWAQTESPAVAFNSPLAFMPVNEFYDGDQNPGDNEIFFAEQLEEKGYKDLAAYVRNGRLLHRFSFCNGYDLGDWKGFLELFQGLREAVVVDVGLDWDEWKAVALKRYENDTGLQSLLERRENPVALEYSN